MNNKLQQFNALLNEGISHEDLSDSLMNRLQMRYPDLLDKYGYDAVEDAVNDVASFHAGAEELGSSDISIMLKEIIKALESSAVDEEVVTLPKWEIGLTVLVKHLGQKGEIASLGGDNAIVTVDNRQYRVPLSGLKRFPIKGVAEDSDPCWDNYKQIGMKMKGGKKVPNCVPKESVEEGQLSNFEIAYKTKDGNSFTVVSASSKDEAIAKFKQKYPSARATSIRGTGRSPIKEEGIEEDRHAEHAWRDAVQTGKALAQQAPAKYFLKDRATGKVLGQFNSAPDAVRGAQRFGGNEKCKVEIMREDGVLEAYDDFRNKERTQGEQEPTGIFTVLLNGKPWIEGSSNEMFTAAERVARKYPMKKVQVRWPNGAINTVGGQVNELSTNKLAQYKTAASKDASIADKAGDFKRGDKRFAGIVKATKKQFDNDAKQVKESSIMKGLRNVK